MSAIETQNLSRSFKGKTAVKNLSMHIPKGIKENKNPNLFPIGNRFGLYWFGAADRT